MLRVNNAMKNFIAFVHKKFRRGEVKERLKRRLDVADSRKIKLTKKSKNLDDVMQGVG